MLGPDGGGSGRVGETVVALGAAAYDSVVQRLGLARVGICPGKRQPHRQSLRKAGHNLLCDG
jgi:hypothetical protein